MAFNDVIPSSIILEMLKGYQYTLPLYTPEYEIKEEYCTSVPDDLVCTRTETGSSYSSSGTVDHPSFTRLREHLGARGYIKIERGWSNGDRVTKKFLLNGVTFEVGDRFLCADAMRWKLFREY